jgi:hypothetical protein
MMQHQATCIVCDRYNLVDTYGDWTCDFCGQNYEYDEGHRILLSPDQLSAVRRLPVLPMGMVQVLAHAVHTGSLGGDRGRPFTGQAHTWGGERGQASIPAMRYRDLGDTIVEALSAWHRTVSGAGLPALDRVDTEALAQAILHRIAQRQQLT